MDLCITQTLSPFIYQMLVGTTLVRNLWLCGLCLEFSRLHEKMAVADKPSQISRSVMSVSVIMLFNWWSEKNTKLAVSVAWGDLYCRLFVSKIEVHSHSVAVLKCFVVCYLKQNLLAQTLPSIFLMGFWPYSHYVLWSQLGFVITLCHSTAICTDIAEILNKHSDITWKCDLLHWMVTFFR